MAKGRKPVRYFVADTENAVPRTTLMDDADETNLFSSNTPESAVEAPTYNSPAKFVTRVWAFAICPVGGDVTSDDVEVYNNIVDGCTAMAALPNSDGDVPVVFFHNLAYDAPLILSHLVGEGYTVEQPDIVSELVEGEGGKSRKRNRPNPRMIRTAVTEGVWYSMKITFDNGRTVELRDSLKLLPFTVDAIGRSLNTRAKKLKGSIDYSLPRPVGHVITDTERAYIENDVLVMAEAMHLIENDFPGYLKNLTIGSACMRAFKISLGARELGIDMDELTDKESEAALLTGKEMWEEISEFCSLEEDNDIRSAYRGGWCYVNRDNPLISRNQAVDLTESDTKGMVYDVNSLYPSVMYNHRYPWGTPAEVPDITGKGLMYLEKVSMEYIVDVNVAFTVKKDHVPFIQLKGSSIFAENEYVKDSEGVVNLTLTKPDVELMMEQYNIISLKVNRMWIFDHTDNIFDDYINHFYKVKERASLEGNAVLRMIAKLHLNNLYGKMAQSAIRPVTVPDVEDGVVSMVELGEEIGRGGYIPAGAYITAYARAVTVRAAQANFERFFYADTDSVHMLGEAVGIEVDGEKLGAWDNEGKFDLARYVRQKTYVERIIKGEDRHIDIKACGASGGVKERLRYKVADNSSGDWKFSRIKRDDNDIPTNEPRSDREIIERMQPGLKEAGKLSRKAVTGGTILYETTFSIHGDPSPVEWTMVH